MAFVQRFDSGMRLNVHFHVLWLDGAYGHEVGRGAVQWREHEELADKDVASLVRRVRDRVVKALRREGKWWDGDDAAEAEADCRDEERLMLVVSSGAVVGRAALGEHAGAADARVDRGTRNEPFVKGPLCADCGGFSLHAGVRVPAGDRRRLEHLARYAGRPAIAILANGMVAKRWRNACGVVGSRDSSRSSPARSIAHRSLCRSPRSMPIVRPGSPIVGAVLMPKTVEVGTATIGVLVESVMAGLLEPNRAR